MPRHVCKPTYPQDQLGYLVERRVVAILRIGSLTPATLKAELLRLWGPESAAAVGMGTHQSDLVDLTFAFWPGDDPRMQMTYYVKGEGVVFTPEQQAYQEEGRKRLHAHLAINDMRRAASEAPRLKRRKKSA